MAAKGTTEKKSKLVPLRLSVVIPFYNEEKNIPLLLDKLAGGLPNQGIEIILIDNGSTDGSAGVFKKLLSGYKFARMVKVELNQCYGFGILTGLKAAKAKFIGWTHADLQTDPHDVLKTLQIIAAHTSGRHLLVKGLRRGRPFFDNIFTWGIGTFETIHLRTPPGDINAQPTLFHRSLFEGWQNPPHDFSLDLYALYTAKHCGFHLLRFPVLIPERIHGTSC